MRVSRMYKRLIRHSRSREKRRITLLLPLIRQSKHKHFFLIRVHIREHVFIGVVEHKESFNSFVDEIDVLLVVGGPEKKFLFVDEFELESFEFAGDFTFWGLLGFLFDDWDVFD